MNIKCADQGILIRGGGGGPDTTARNSIDSVFFLFFFVLCSPQPINRGVPMGFFQRGSIIFQGVQLYPGMGGGGPNVNFYRSPYITCDFLSPPPRLDPRMHNNLYSSC